MIRITKDNFVWMDVTHICKQGEDRTEELCISGLQIYEVTPEETDHALQTWDEVEAAINNGSRICIEVGHLPLSYRPRKLWDGVEKKLIDGYWYAKISDQALAEV